MAGWSRRAVLSLYRSLLRRAGGLRYTDRDFYRASVQRQFRLHQRLREPEAQARLLRQGRAFLRSGLGGLL